MFKVGKFYKEKKTGRMMAIIGNVTEVFYPYDSGDDNLIAQMDRGDIVPIYNLHKKIRSEQNISSEVWVNIPRKEWVDYLAKLKKENVKSVASRYKRGVVDVDACLEDSDEDTGD